jgi:hypothetical protein
MTMPPNDDSTPLAEAGGSGETRKTIPHILASTAEYAPWGQCFAAALKGNPGEAYLRQFGPEDAASRDYAFSVSVTDCCVVGIGVGK